LRFWDLGWSLLDRIPIDDAKGLFLAKLQKLYIEGFETSVLLKDIFYSFF
jgi:hypothetical protein